MALLVPPVKGDLNTLANSLMRSAVQFTEDVDAVAAFTDAYDAATLATVVSGGDLAWATNFKNAVGNLKALVAALRASGDFAITTRSTGPVT